MSTTLFQWVVSHFAIIGWPTVLYGVYRFIKFLVKATHSITVAVQRVVQAEATLTLVANNHLPHIQVATENTDKAVQEVNKTMLGIRDDLRILMVRD